MNFRKINIITGHYGSGKTNVSVNMALDLAEKGEKVENDASIHIVVVVYTLLYIRCISGAGVAR